MVSTSEYQKERAARLKEKGLRAMQLWTYPEDRAQIRRYAEKLRKVRALALARKRVRKAVAK